MLEQGVEISLLLGRKAMTNVDSILKSRDITLPTKAHLVKAMFFPSSHVWMWELDYKASWAPKNWCFWTMVLEKTLESPLDGKEIQLVNPKGNQSWIFIGRTDAEAEAPILWSLDVKKWLIGKDPDAGKDWRQEEKGMTEDKMAGWHHWLNGHEFKQAPGVGDGQGNLAYCSPRGHKESDTTKRLNWTEFSQSVSRVQPTNILSILYIKYVHVLFHKYVVRTYFSSWIRLSLVQHFCHFYKFLL